MPFFLAAFLLVNRLVAANVLPSQEMTLSSSSPTSEVAYGNSEYGYFSRQIHFPPGKISFRFHPPGYRYPLQWFVKTSTGWQCHSPRALKKTILPKDLLGNISLNGKLSSPFFLLNGYLETRKDEKSFIYLLNRQGELVWYFFPRPSPPSDDPRVRTLVTKPMGKGEYAILQVYNQSRFQIIDTEGTQKIFVEPDKAESPYPVHHDFAWNKGKLLTFSNYSGDYRKWWKFWAAPLSFLSSPLVEVDFNRNQATEKWDYMKLANPYSDPDWTFNEKDSGYFWNTWGKPHARNNFIHANSIQHIEGKGFLLSIRSLNKVLLLSEDYKTILWSLGPSKHNTFPTRGTPYEFIRQHHATLLDNGNLLLFDNHWGKSRILELELDIAQKRIRLKHEFTPDPKVISPRHGSAYRLANGNTLGYFANTYSQQAPNAIVEFDAESAKETARISTDLGLNSVGYRAVPVNSIATEVYLGETPPRVCPTK